MPGNAKHYAQYEVPIRMTHKESLRLLGSLVTYLGYHFHREPDGCTDDDCPCFANGYEQGRQDEAEEPGEPVRDESRD
jgi:hypothetical protein